MSVNSGEQGVEKNMMDQEGKSRSEGPRIYLDHNATTPLDAEVREAMLQFMDEGFGNPSSIYREGKDTRHAVEAARRSLAQMLNCTAKRIVFTGCGSESNNLAIKGVAYANRGKKSHIITTTVEHPSVLETCRWLEANGLQVTYLDVDKTGRVNPADLAAAITRKTCLASIMTANNETGTIQPVAVMAGLAREKGVLFHTDATQAIGKITVDTEALGVDLLTLSGHKFYGPKGVGALYIRKGVEIEPILHGGSQEGGMRAGTENMIGIVGLGKAAELAVKNLPDMERVRDLRNRLESGIKGLLDDAKLNGHPMARLPNTLNMILPGMRGESVVMAMDQKGVAISSGSACRSGSPKPSHALMAMGLSEEDAHCALRFSLGLSNTSDEIDRVISLLAEIVKYPDSAVRFLPCR